MTNSIQRFQYQSYNIEVLGLIDLYGSFIVSVGYEDYVLKISTGERVKPMLEDLRVWMWFRGCCMFILELLRMVCFRFFDFFYQMLIG